MKTSWIISVFSLAVLAGCGGTGDPSGAGPSPSQPDSASPASLDCPSADTVKATLGVATGAPAKTVNGIVILCNYAPTVATGGNVLVRFQTEENAAGFAAGRSGFESSGQKTVDVAGLGDQAFSSTLGGGSLTINTLVARQGAVEVLVTSRASVDKEKALVAQVFGTL